MLRDRSLVKVHEIKIRLDDYNNEALEQIVEMDGRAKAKIVHDIIENYLIEAAARRKVPEQKQA